ncbi:hypothetical protein RIF29_42324 [Crotalaria pallida]|uniref:Uncharacterized protein n=1 Tax=Crotalaria pallida TaxID=3830 RepID=A0AAN9HSG2_CROPI
MESEDNLNGTVFETRPALADVTNRPPKRPFSSISGAGDDADLHLQKQICLGKEDSIANRCQSQIGEADKRRKDKGKSVCVGSDIWDDSNLLTQNPLGFGEKNQDRTIIDSGGVSEGTRGVESEEMSEFCVGDELPLGVELPMPTISASHDPKFFGLERCTALKGEAGGNSAAIAAAEDLIKSCTCSFCSKAAYIWSDLYYQDVKGRLTALRKSQKEADLLVCKFSGLKEPVMSDKQNTSESSELELSLMNQWKSLFVHMENTFAQESSQVESKCESLKNLRDSCKTDLELTDNSHSSDNH